MPSITQLEYLVAVDRYRNIGRAATACHISQPTLSMQLRKLEEELETVVFDRSKQPVLPTEAGLPLIQQAKAVLREHEKLRYLSSAQGKELHGTFRLGVIPTIAPYLLPRFVLDFVEAHSKLELSIEESTTAALVASLLSDELDAAIVATPLQQPGLTEEVLYYEPLQAFVSKNHRLYHAKRLKLEELDEGGAWLLREGHCLREQMLKVCHGKGCVANLHFESGDLETLVQFVLRGTGYTLLPQLCAEAQESRGHGAHLKRFASPVPAREVSLVYRRTEFKRREIEALVGAVRGSVDGTLPWTMSDSITRLGIAPVLDPDR